MDADARINRSLQNMLAQVVKLGGYPFNNPSDAAFIAQHAADPSRSENIILQRQNRSLANPVAASASQQRKSPVVSPAIIDPKQSLNKKLSQVARLGGYPLNDPDDAAFIAQLAVETDPDNNVIIERRLSDLSTTIAHNVYRSALIVAATTHVRDVVSDFYATFDANTRIEDHAPIDDRASVLVRIVRDTRNYRQLEQMTSLLFASFARSFGKTSSPSVMRNINLVANVLLGVEFKKLPSNTRKFGWINAIWSRWISSSDDDYDDDGEDRDDEGLRSQVVEPVEAMFVRPNEVFNPYIYEGIVKAPSTMVVNQRQLNAALKRPDDPTRQEVAAFDRILNPPRPSLRKDAKRWQSERKWTKLGDLALNVGLLFNKVLPSVGAYLPFSAVLGGAAAAPTVVLLTTHRKNKPRRSKIRTLEAILPKWFIPMATSSDKTAYEIILFDFEARAFAIARASCDLQFLLQEVYRLGDILNSKALVMIYRAAQSLSLLANAFVSNISSKIVSSDLIQYITMYLNAIDVPADPNTLITPIGQGRYDDKFGRRGALRTKDETIAAMIVATSVVSYFIGVRTFVRDATFNLSQYKS